MSQSPPGQLKLQSASSLHLISQPPPSQLAIHDVSPSQTMLQPPAAFMFFDVRRVRPPQGLRPSLWERVNSEVSTGGIHQAPNWTNFGSVSVSVLRAATGAHLAVTVHRYWGLKRWAWSGQKSRSDQAPSTVSRNVGVQAPEDVERLLAAATAV
jgi:hypothetical protein